jgi:outer membrane protein TolC
MRACHTFLAIALRGATGAVGLATPDCRGWLRHPQPPSFLVGLLAAWLFHLSANLAVAQPAATQVPYRVIYPEARQITVRESVQLAPAMLPPSSPPPTVASPDNLRESSREIPLDEAIRIALENDRVIRVLAGVTAVNSGRTIYDVAIANTQIDQAQARFDPAITIENNWDHFELPTAFPDPGDPTQTIIGGLTTNQYRLNAALTKENPLGGQFRVGASATQGFFKPGVFPLNPETNSSADLGYTQPLLQGFGRRANLAPIVLARIDTERSFFQLKDAVQEQVRGVIEAYWNLVNARIDVWATERQIEQAEFSYQFALQRFRFGLRNGSDQAQARTSLANFRASLITARNNAIQREAALRNILGLPPWDQSLLVPTTEPTVAHFLPDWQMLTDLAAQQRPDLIELKLILEADQQQLIIANNNALPRLDAAGLYRWNGLEGEMPNGNRISTAPGQFSDWTLGVNFSVPIGLRQGRAQLRQRELILARDQANLDQGLHAASHDLATTVRSLEQAYQQYLAFKEAREAAAENLVIQDRIFQGEFEASFSYLNVLLAITDWGNAIRNEASAVTNYNTLLAELERQSGTILETHGIRFYEERYGSIGPLGRLHPGVCYPQASPPTPNADRYPPGNRPAEEFFNLKEPVEPPALRAEPIPPPAPMPPAPMPPLGPARIEPVLPPR